MHGIAVFRVDQIGGAELGRQLQFDRVGVDSDDAAGACDRRAVDGGHADAAAANDDDGLAGPNLRGIDGGAKARDDAATDQRADVEGHVLVDFHDGVLVHQHLLGIR